jgi:hypothetical protein
MSAAEMAHAGVSIVFDYSFDSNGFFTPERRAIAQAAATSLTSRMTNTTWARVDTSSTGGSYEQAIINPSTLEVSWVPNVVIPENQITVYLGAMDWSAAPVSKFRDSSGDSVTQLFSIRNVSGGIAAVLASPSKLRPVNASISFDLQGTQGLKPGITRQWYFGSATNLNTDDRNPADPYYYNYVDFYTSLVHELGHILGIYDSVAGNSICVSGENFCSLVASDPNFYMAWTSRIQSDGQGGYVFNGPHASQFYYNHVGQSIPLDADNLSHWAVGVHSQTADGWPSVTHDTNTPFRYGFSELEFGALADMGYTINPLLPVSALFVNASTSTNKTSILRIINTTNSPGTLSATAYDELGNQLGTANAYLGLAAANQALTFTSAQLESAIGFTPSAPTSKYSVNFATTLSGFDVINYTQDNATGNLTLSQSQTADRAMGASAASVTRQAWFVSSSTSTNKTNVLRIINTSSQSSTLSGIPFDESGNYLGISGSMGTGMSLGTISAHQMVSYTSDQLESALRFTPASPTSKYRVAFYAAVPSMELINFTKDIATGNLTLVQAQLEDRPSSTATTSIRNALVVYPSTNTSRNTVIRIVNPNATSATVSATVYDESGMALKSGSLGLVGPNQILALTSDQFETALGYTPTATAKYRLVVSANVPTFEMINDIKVPATGNLYLAQAQTDNRVASSVTTTTRKVHVIYPSNSAVSTTQLLVINTTAQSAALTVTAYDYSGNQIAVGKSLGTLGANQMLTFTSAQLESLMGYNPPTSSSKWRMVISASLSNFEAINYTKDVLTGIIILAQPQTE